MRASPKPSKPLACRSRTLTPTPPEPGFGSGWLPQSKSRCGLAINRRDNQRTPVIRSADSTLVHATFEALWRTLAAAIETRDLLRQLPPRADVVQRLDQIEAVIESHAPEIQRRADL